MAKKKIKEKPKPLSVSFGEADRKLLDRLKMDTEIFQTTALLRWAMREAAKSIGAK